MLCKMGGVGTGGSSIICCFIITCQKTNEGLEKSL